tara:strand:+ start:531 stop:1241 length:711 start_codon:yes stop_codon:yes gene_type:complete
MNKLFTKNIKLQREEHKYILNTNPDLEFTSVTTFIGQFFEEFNAKKIATKLVTSNRNYMGMTVEEVLATWNDAAEHGTKVHEELENYILNKDTLTEPKSIQGMNWLNKYKMKSSFDVYPEVIIYSEELKLSGTIDLLLFDKINNKYIIMDWKTSKKIDTKSYKNKRGTKPASANIEDTKFNHYALQLSLYRYLLEEYYGIEVTQHLIIHLKDNECLGLHVPYMKENVLKMVNSIGD